MRRELERIAIPEEHEARERAFVLVERAFGEHAPMAPRNHRVIRPVLLLATFAVLAGAVASSPGRAVVERAREAVGVERAAPALFRLPAPGRLLVSSDAGAWVVEAKGSRRLLGAYREASWSPFGRFVVTARGNELVTLEPDGTVRWSLPRPGALLPRWAGTETDTRIAYLVGSRLHVVAGDGTGDVDAGGPPAAARVAPAWRPGPGFVVAYADTRGRIVPVDTRGGMFWQAPGRSARMPGLLQLTWSDDGQRLAAVTPTRISFFGPRTPVPLAVRPGRGAVEAAFRPGTRELTVIHRNGEASEVRVGSRVLFSLAGELRGLSWSPDGRWLLVGSPASDQWVFVRADGRRQLVAVSNISAQLHSESFPRVEGWCCVG